MMSVQLDLSKLPPYAQLEIDIRLTAPIHVTALEARRRVSRLVISELGNLLHGGDATLVVGERISWRVPVLLAYPDRGVVGQVGDIDVDVQTGAVLASVEQLKDLADYALFLAQRTPVGPT
jgi:hypothetical protein